MDLARLRKSTKNIRMGFCEVEAVSRSLIQNDLLTVPAAWPTLQVTRFVFVYAWSWIRYTIYNKLLHEIVPHTALSFDLVCRVVRLVLTSISQALLAAAGRRPAMLAVYRPTLSVQVSPFMCQRGQSIIAYRCCCRGIKWLRAVFSSLVFTARRVCIARTMPWQDR